MAPLALVARRAPDHGRAARRGAFLAELAWPAAERELRPESIVVLPIGAAAKEHGPHLRLSNDWIMAEYLAARLVEVEDVVVAPTLSYHFYPAFLEYPGSTSLRLETARDLVVDVCRSLARFGPRRFYALNTGISTVRALAPAAELLASEGITLTFTDLERALEPTQKKLLSQDAGTHADEAETSIMLAIAPDAVDMTKAVRDIHPLRPPGLTRDANSATGTYSPTGVYGDATLATQEKGERLVDALLTAIRSDVSALRR
jgi:creatinine amidohydrolase